MFRWQEQSSHILPPVSDWERVGRMEVDRMLSSHSTPHPVTLIELANQTHPLLVQCFRHRHRMRMLSRVDILVLPRACGCRVFGLLKPEIAWVLGQRNLDFVDWWH